MTKAILPFRDLLAFASGYPSQIESIEKISMPEELVPGYNPRIRVVFKPWKAIGEAVTSQGSWRDVRLFGLTGSQYTDWNRIVNTWFHLRNEIDSVLGLYLVSIYRRDQFPYLEAEFLNAIQALESFHDRLRTKNRSSRKRRPTLAERIGDLLEEQQAFLKPIIPDFTSFQASVKDTRNFFTHYNEELEKRRLQPLELIDAIDTIWVLLQVLIMEELGIPRETARKNVAHTRRYRDIGTRQIISYS